MCGACCNHVPELELGEASALADTFVLRLMLRIYSLPRAFGDVASDLPRDQASAEFYESKRLLAQFSAASWPAKVRRGDRVVDYVQYLSLSVLPLDLGIGRCPALEGETCGIYTRRPLSCRSVPLHYSRPAAAALRELDAFAATTGFHCDTGPDAPMVIAGNQIVDPAMLTARAAATAQAQTDQRWKVALVTAMKAGEFGLPTPREVEAEAARGALSASMLCAWQVAEAAGLIERDTITGFLTAQCQLIEHSLDQQIAGTASAQTLKEMLGEYRGALAA